MSGASILNWQQYEAALDPLTKELSDAARWIQETGQRVVILFEGRDTAGKGGSIDMFARTLNPRQCKVVALSAPSKREQGQWYFQRYAEHFPSKGEITLFDRSWYNRAGVEKVMGYCSEDQAEAFLRATPEFERHLVEDGMLLFKYWLTCDQDQQEQRFAERVKDPLKRWKLSPIDQAARAHYAEYTTAREAMLKATDTKFAPWTLVNFNDQKRGRLTLVRDLLDRMPETAIPDDAKVDWSALGHPPINEHFAGKKPIPDFPIHDVKHKGDARKAGGKTAD